MRISTMHDDSRTAAEWLQMSHTYREQFRLEECIDAADKAIALQPDLAAAYNNRGYAQAYAGYRQQALDDHSRAIELKPDFAAAYHERGIVYFESGELEDALADYNQALTLEPNHAAARISRALLYRKLAQWQNALADYNQVLTVQTDDPDVYTGRGRVYFALSQYENARDDFQAANHLEPDFALSGLALALHALGDTQQAHQHWQALCEIDDRYHDADWMTYIPNWPDAMRSQAQKLIAELA